MKNSTPVTKATREARMTGEVFFAVDQGFRDARGRIEWILISASAFDPSSKEYGGVIDGVGFPPRYFPRTIS